MRRQPPVARLAAILARLAADRRGATALEYGLILALITIAMLVTFGNVAGATMKMWNRVSNEVQTAR